MEIGARYTEENPEKTSKYNRLTLAFWYDRPTGFRARKFVPVIEELKSKGKILHGHPLIFKRITPPTLSEDELKPYLLNKVSGFESLIDHWDVLDESDGFLSHLGDDWRLKALEVVRTKCPNAKLWINEYAIQNRTYWDRTIEFAEKAANEGLLDGVGIQQHLDIRGMKAVTKMVRTFAKERLNLSAVTPLGRLEKEVKRIHDLGLLSRISEISIMRSKFQKSSAESILSGLIDKATELDCESLTYWDFPVIKVGKILS